MIKGKHILITGGGGFIGTQLAQRLAQNNLITLLDLDFDQNAIALTQLRTDKNIITKSVDILNLDRLAEVAREAQIVIHLAAVIGVQTVLYNHIKTLEVNYIGTSNLLKTISPDCERFIIFSTSEVYGANAFGVSEDGDVLLPSIQNPRWGYSISKLASEHLAFGYHRERGLPVVIIRPFNVFGPGRIGRYAVLEFALNALKGENLVVNGDGTQIRSWCYIDDFLVGVLAAAEIPEAIGNAFNIGNPRNTVTVYDLAKRIVSLSGSKSKIVFKPLDFQDINLRVPDISKARKMLGYDPKIDVEEGLVNTIEWVRKNYDRIVSA